MLLTAVQDSASVPPFELVKFFPARQGVHYAVTAAEYVVEEHCRLHVHV
jgi:hypothetical protein